ncbi:response regulator transcription factor [candidate division WOR-3 bacterium]|nr:response regulator transcription factor [candidate division WOR-3 bacterium]
MISIYLADDHKLVRSGLKRIIEENPDYIVSGEIGDGLHLIREIREHTPNLLILDISMPYLRGIEAITKIRRFNKKTKILIVTMHKNNEYVCECLLNGAQGYILKDDADEELMKAIHVVLEGSFYISSSFSSEILQKLIQTQKQKVKKKRTPIFEELTNREREILKLLAEGYSNKKTADILGISVRTVEHHRLRIMQKNKLKNTADLIKYAIKTGLLDLL